MLHQEFAPPQQLQDTIRCFWYNCKDFGEGQSSFDVVPDGYAEIIFYFGAECSMLAEGNLQALPSPFMVGLLNQPAIFYTEGRFEVIGIRCFPWTVFDLLGLPAGKDSVRVFEHPIAGLQPVLADYIKSGKIDEAIGCIRQYFLETKLEHTTDPSLRKAGVAMNQANGTMQVNQVADAAHTTVRTLERKFKQSAGHTVKDVSGLMRFEQIRNRLWHQPQSNLAALAAEFGYTDQAHLSREFKRYSGTTPAAFARKARHDRPFDGVDFVAFVQS